MREILFRGKAVSSGEWVYGNLIHSKRFAGCGNEWRIHNQDTGLESDVDPETVGQYTGLTDKNGVKIFEGDVIKMSGLANWNYEVYFENSAFRLRYKTSHGDYYSWGCLFRAYELDPSYGEPEIVGSIHDNPELLK